MSDYLKDKQHYIDLYDLYTIKMCLKEIDLWREIYKESFNAEEIKHLSEEERKRSFNQLLGQELFVKTGERHRIKEETIRKWIDSDSAEQSKYDNTPDPNDILHRLGEFIKLFLTDGLNSEFAYLFGLKNV